jgi:uncharacterized membrane protein YcaP (DUF421 family)
MTLYDYILDIFHFDYYIRAIVVTFYALFLFRIGNTRLFSQMAAYDLFIFVILGALLGQAIISKQSFVSSLICCSIITLLHKYLGSLAQKWSLVKFLKGERRVLYTNKQWERENLESCNITKDDIFQELRCSLGLNSTETINKIIMERNGKISFLQFTDTPDPQVLSQKDL